MQQHPLLKNLNSWVPPLGKISHIEEAEKLAGCCAATSFYVVSVWVRGGRHVRRSSASTWVHLTRRTMDKQRRARKDDVFSAQHRHTQFFQKLHFPSRQERSDLAGLIIWKLPWWVFPKKIKIMHPPISSCLFFPSQTSKEFSFF